MTNRLRGGRADLHTHSNVSDGTESPANVVCAAAVTGLTTVALTDHDSTAGWDEAGSAAGKVGVRLIPGMELSTRVRDASIHVLAYLFDPLDEALREETRRIRHDRRTRAQNIVRRINRDYDLSWEDVLAQAGKEATIGRPHIADALVARGHVLDRADAFAYILHWRSGYTQPHYAPDPLTGVRLIRDAGGVPVLAHPGTRGAEAIMPKSQLRVLVEAGLFGLEVEHRDNRPDAKLRLAELAKKYGLVVTGSSDYHGTGKPNRLGEHTTTPEVVDRIIAEGTGSVPVGFKSNE